MMERFQNGRRQAFSSCWEALNLSEQCDNVISFVGAGGKTSLMFAMAEEAALRGYRVIVTTSTKIYKPDHYQVFFAERAEALADAVWEGNILVVGRMFSEEKLKGLPYDEIGALAEFADILLIEADGARRLPLKIPDANEPVIVPDTKAVIGCAGLDSIGRSFFDGCFRFELAEAVLGKSAEDVITGEDVAEVLSSMAGGRKDVGNRTYRAVLNKSDLVPVDIADNLALLLERKLNMPYVGLFCLKTFRTE